MLSGFYYTYVSVKNHKSLLTFCTDEVHQSLRRLKHENSLRSRRQFCWILHRPECRPSANVLLWTTESLHIHNQHMIIFTKSSSNINSFVKFRNFLFFSVHSEHIILPYHTYRWYVYIHICSYTSCLLFINLISWKFQLRYERILSWHICLICICRLLKLALFSRIFKQNCCLIVSLQTDKGSYNFFNSFSIMIIKIYLFISFHMNNIPRFSKIICISIVYIYFQDCEIF